jgi:GNAT superfamily N-acetyltransferase
LSGARVSILRFAEHPLGMETLVRAFEAEWPEWYLGGKADARSDLHARMQTGALPLALVALQDGEVAGTVTLAAHAIPLDRALTHAVIGLLVLPSWRGQGIAAALLHGAAREARSQGF